MGINEFFQTIQWGATLQIAAIRIAIASMLWPLLFVILGNTTVAEFFPQVFSLLLMLTAFIAIAIPAIGLARANVPLVGLAALPAWLVVIADPLVKIIHSKKPEWVPVEEFKFINPPVLAIFTQPQDSMPPVIEQAPNFEASEGESSQSSSGTGLFDNLQSDKGEK